MSPSGGPYQLKLDNQPSLLKLLQTHPNIWSFFLSSQGHAALATARWSILMRRSGQTISHSTESPSHFWAQLQNQLDETLDRDSQSELPFQGGWFIYLGYEMAQSIEPTLNQPHFGVAIPDAYAERVMTAIIQDHFKNEFWLVSETKEELEQAQEEIEASESAGPSTVQTRDAMSWDLAEDDSTLFMQGVEKIRDYIVAGDVFQVNLSRGWCARADQSIDPVQLYGALEAHNPAPFSGLAQVPGGWIVSSSPERLVSRQGDQIQTRPIAGTRPRGLSGVGDQMLITELKENLKERAEHIMLIDLERNDLGRVCRPGSVEVSELMAIESYEHVHHIVSNVMGRVDCTVKTCDIIRAVFPGGTITGCPKVRCMEIIAELEGVGRGPYTGAMGYIGHGNVMDLNILIRTLLVADRDVHFRTGAGIVFDSTPEAEWFETAAKAKGLLAAIGSMGQLR